MPPPVVPPGGVRCRSSGLGRAVLAEGRPRCRSPVPVREAGPVVRRAAERCCSPPLPSSPLGAARRAALPPRLLWASPKRKGKVGVRAVRRSWGGGWPTQRGSSGLQSVGKVADWMDLPHCGAQKKNCYMGARSQAYGRALVLEDSGLGDWRDPQAWRSALWDALLHPGDPSAEVPFGVAAVPLSGTL